MLNAWYILGWVLLAVCVVVAFLAALVACLDSGGDPEGPVILTIVALVLVGALVFSNWPLFDTSFHRNERKSFYVQSVNTRVLNQTTVYAVTDMSDRTYKCVDTRCAVLRPFDHVTLSCLKQWQRYGTPGFDCDYVSARRAGR